MTAAPPDQSRRVVRVRTRPAPVLSPAPAPTDPLAQLKAALDLLARLPGPEALAREMVRRRADLPGMRRRLRRASQTVDRLGITLDARQRQRPDVYAPIL